MDPSLRILHQPRRRPRMFHCFYLCLVRIQVENISISILLWSCLPENNHEHPREHQSTSTTARRTQTSSTESYFPSPQDVLHHQIRRHLLGHRSSPWHYRRCYRGRQPRSKPRRAPSWPSHQPARRRRLQQSVGPVKPVQRLQCWWWLCLIRRSGFPLPQP